MYARSNMPQDPRRDESGGAQSFRRGSYNIPASYRGNAFSTDFSPTEEELTSNIASDTVDPTEYERSPERFPTQTQDDNRNRSDEPSLPVMSKSREQSCHEEEDPHGGFLHELLNKLDRGLEIDDLLLIGLILLLSHDGESSSDTLILLAFLFFMGI